MLWLTEMCFTVDFLLSFGCCQCCYLLKLFFLLLSLVVQMLRMHTSPLLENGWMEFGLAQIGRDATINFHLRIRRILFDTVWACTWVTCIPGAPKALPSGNRRGKHMAHAQIVQMHSFGDPMIQNGTRLHVDVFEKCAADERNKNRKQKLNGMRTWTPFYSVTVLFTRFVRRVCVCMFVCLWNSNLVEMDSVYIWSRQSQQKYWSCFRELMKCKSKQI